MTLDQRLTWKDHITSLIIKIRSRIRQLSYLLANRKLPLQLKILVYKTLIRPIWLYGSGLWCSASITQIKRIQVLQNRVLRLITSAPWYVRNDELHKDLEIPTVHDALTAAYHNMYIKGANHPNPLIKYIHEHRPPPRHMRRLKRRHHTDNADGFD